MKYPIIFGTLCLIMSTTAYQTGKGKFQSYNGNRYTEAKSLNDNGVKLFLNQNRERAPPSHDTV